MRICNLILNFKPYYSGRGVYWSKVIEKLVKFNHESFVLSANYDDFSQYEKIDFIDVYRVNLNKKDHHLIESLKIAIKLFSLRDRYDIIHLHGYCDAWGVLTFLSKILRKKIIFHMTLLGSDDPLVWKKHYKFMAIRYKLLANIDRFISHSPPITRSYYESPLPDKKLIEIPNGVELDRFRPPYNAEEKNVIRYGLGIPFSGKVACFVGAVIERKGVQLLVDIWKNNRNINDTCMLLIVGPYEFKEAGKDQKSYREMLFGLVDKYDLNIKFVGSTDEVDKYLRASDYFLFPSKNEGFGNVIVEALASGLPTICSPLDGISSMILGDDSGFIANSEKDWVDLISFLMNEEEKCLELSVKARNRVVSKFDINAICERYSALYNELYY